MLSLEECIDNATTAIAWLRNLLLELHCAMCSCTLYFKIVPMAYTYLLIMFKINTLNMFEIDLHFVRKRIAIGHTHLLFFSLHTPHTQTTLRAAFSVFFGIIDKPSL